jgi:hypothetical protein
MGAPPSPENGWRNRAKQVADRDRLWPLRVFAALLDFVECNAYLAVLHFGSESLSKYKGHHALFRADLADTLCQNWKEIQEERRGPPSGDPNKPHSVERVLLVGKSPRRCLFCPGIRNLFGESRSRTKKFCETCGRRYPICKHCSLDQDHHCKKMKPGKK